MPNVDLNAAIAAIVADAVKQELEPYMATLDKVAAFVGAAPARRGPGRPRKAIKPVPFRRFVHPRRPRGSKSKAAVRAAKKLSPGQKVTYQQGRGSFEAKVVSVDAAKGTVVLERVKDGKKVKRPAAKVIAA